MRMQLALNVDDLDVAIDYYGRLFGVDVNKREPGYANFVVPSHGLKLVLFEAPGAERLNHVGFEVFDESAVDRASRHLKTQDLLDDRQQGEVCCYARQNKAVSYDPQGLMWEWYQVLEDSGTFGKELTSVVSGPAVGSPEVHRPRGCCVNDQASAAGPG